MPQAAAERVFTVFGQGVEKATAATFEVELTRGVPSDLVHLVPMGQCIPNDGRLPWILEDEAHAEAVIAATVERLGARDFHFDYDHQAERAPAVAGTAIAAGWVRPQGLFADSQGIWARGVTWTAAATQRLHDREYRYISPWFGFEKKSRRITRLFNAALTNNPAFELAAVAAQSTDGDDHDMSMKAIAAALGLAEDAGEDLILSSIGTLKSSTATAAIALGLAGDAGGEALAVAATNAAGLNAVTIEYLPQLRSTLGLAEDADFEAIATAAADVKAKADAGPDPAKFVPIEELAAANAKLDSINTEKGEAEVDAANAAGKLTPANRAWGLQSFRADPEGFATAMGNQPAILKPGAEGVDELAGTAASLTEDEKALCASMGWDEETFAAGKKAEAEGE